jgi:error-prone DNA polymerase
MPEQPLPRIARPEVVTPAPPARPAIAYAELHARSCFSFLRGASHPDELVTRAAELGYRAIAVTDEASLAGVVRAHVAAKKHGVKLILGTELTLRESEGSRLLLHARDRRGYGNLSRLLTLGRRRVARADGERASDYALTFDDVAAHAEGLLAVLVPGESLARAELPLARVRETFGPLASLALELHRGPDDDARLAAVRDLGARLDVRLVAANDVHCHVPERRRLAAVLACIREGTTLDTAGFTIAANGERHLRSLDEIVELHAAVPEAVARSVELADLATFSLDELRYEYPEEIVPPGETPTSYLRALTERGAKERFPEGLPEKVRREIEHELALIQELAYEPYFLTVHDIVLFARGRGILCQGRGSAANSAVCFCLGITSVDPARIEVLFERFVSRHRKEPPDIDVDFEHERREEVLQYVYAKYGRDRAAIAGEVITYRGRSAVRDVGKALGLSLDQVDRLAKNVDWDAKELEDEARLREAGLDPADRTTRLLVELSREIQGFPRHLSQHVGGMVISRGLLSDIVPIQNAAMPDRTFVEWDKDDLDALGLMKVDCLALGMLTCVRKSLDFIRQHEGRSYDLASIPAEDPAVYDMLCKADAVGVFQVESRAQMNMLPRLRPRCFYDLVIEVSIVRPGPIQGGVVHPYLRRRRGDEPVLSICPEADRVLAKTLGVPIFQEQAMRLAIDAAGFSPDEADALRKSMAAWSKKGSIGSFRDRFIAGVIARGVRPEKAAELFERITGFGEYGFPESHAASFAILVYASAWLKRYHPAAFAAGLLNAQPMGFYQPAQIVRDAREHGVPVLPVCVQASGWDTRLERLDGVLGLRLGMRQVKGLRESAARAIEAAQGFPARFTSIEDLARRAGLSREPLERLAEANAFASFGLGRREAVFDALGRRGEAPPLFATASEDRTDVTLPRLTPIESVARDYATVGLSLDRHPIALVRPAIEKLGAGPVAALLQARHGDRASVAGLVICRQRPQTASGIVFFTLEDETGVANLIVRPHVFERFRQVARGSTCLLASGTVEREGEVIHVMVQKLLDLSGVFKEELATRSRDFH